MDGLVRAPLRLVALGAAAIAVLIGGMVLLGWALNTLALTQVIPTWIPMWPLTALGLVMAGAALGFQVGGGGRLRVPARLLAAVVMLLGVAIIIEYATGLRGLERLLFWPTVAREPFPSPGIPAPQSAWMFTLLGGALLTLDVETRRGLRPAELFAAGVGIIALVSLLGYLYGFAPLVQLQQRFIGVALPTVVAAGCLAVGILLARSDRGAMGILMSPTPGGVVARRLLPAFVIVPVLLGWFKLLAERAGLMSLPEGAIFLVMAFIAVSLGLSWTTVLKLNEIDRSRSTAQREVERQRAELLEAHAQLQRHAAHIEAEGIERSEQLRELEARYRIVFEHAEIGIALVDRDGRFVESNRALLAMLGYDHEELSRLTFVDTTYPDDCPEVRAQLQALEAGERDGFQLEKRCYRKDGTIIWSRVTVSAVRDAGGQVEFYVVMLENVSGRRRAEAELARHTADLERLNEELRRADKYKDDFLSVVSHELRTPLNFIMGFGSILDDELAGPLNEQQHVSLRKILNGADRMLVLVNNLLDMGRLQAGRFKIAEGWTEYSEVVEEALSTLRPLADQKQQGLSMEVEVPGEVCVDGQRLVQVLSNLIDNAVKFTPEHGRIKIRAYVSGDDLVTEVTDTGVGIAEADVPRLFTRFQQLDMSPTRSAGGSGLGLSICKGIIEAHGGKIGILSKPGQGSTFWFTVPLRRKHAPVAHA